MIAVLQPHEIDGVTRVALSELLALRARVGKMALPLQVSRAPRAGQQSSRLFGRGMDYAESRIYQRGDDVRRLDWRLTARSGRLHTKLFQEEREGRLLILLDTHASMRFGTRTRFKSVQAARAAAWAAWAAVRVAERVGLMGFGTRDELLSPRAGARGALGICGAIAEWGDRTADADEEPLSAALQRAMRTVHGASRVLLITDGVCCDEPARRALAELSRRARLGVLAVVDPLEVAPTPDGDYPLEHDGVRALLHVHGERQQNWLPGLLGAGHARLTALCRTAGVACRTVDTSGDPFDTVAALLGARGAR